MRNVLERQRITVVFFAIYLVMLVWVLLFKMQFSLAYLPHVQTINLVPYAASAMVNGSVDISEIIQNALVYVPFGFFAAALLRNRPVWQKLLLIAGTSVAIEALQYALAVGRSDITDVINNFAGGVLGLLLYALVRRMCKTEVKTLTVVNVICIMASAVMLALMGALIVANL